MELRAIKNPLPAQRQGPQLSRTIRAGDWWEFKLSPIFATIYATAFLLNISIISLWPLLLLALIALVPGAAYVSVINDFTDLQEDVASGKANRLVGKSRTFIAAVLACCIFPGLAVALYWRGDPLLLSLYLAAWAAFTLYSLPPVRLKSRGVLGLLADASGAHLFPTLLVVGLVYRWRVEPIEPVWFASVAVWSLSFGLRGILWHQLSDLHNDEKVGLHTFARRHKIARLKVLGNFVIFPAELAAFAVMLWRADSRLCLALLCFYALLEWSRLKLWEMNLVVVVPKARFHIVMHEYYEVFFPLALLLSSSGRYPPDALLIAAHLFLFPRRALQSLKDIVKLMRDARGRFF
ncbi:MAG: UbiA family prenyltransferase [Acidobacteria bacterium]|nr:UbiA family prenyltransferase [Acidobacteriota bacterium]